MYVFWNNPICLEVKGPGMVRYMRLPLRMVNGEYTIEEENDPQDLGV